MSEPAPWTTLFTRVKLALPGATDAVIRGEINALMVDFTKHTNLWTEEVPFVTQQGNYDYPLTLPSSEGTPHRLVVVYDPNQIPPYRWYMDGISMPVPGTLHFTRDPGDQNLVALVTKFCSTLAVDSSTPPKPTGYYDIDDWIVDKHTDALFYGTLAYLQSLPAKTFSNPQEALRNQVRYHSLKGQARAEWQRSNLYGGQNWQYPQGWSSIARKGWA